MKNVIAKDLRTPKYKLQKIQPKKGKGSYKRLKTPILTNRGFVYLKMYLDNKYST